MCAASIARSTRQPRQAGTLRELFTDGQNRVRLYVLEGGSDDSAQTLRYYYDPEGALRFLFVSANAVNGTQEEHRIYFDRAGERIHVDRRKLSGPGWAWGDPETITDPVGHFEAASVCPEKTAPVAASASQAGDACRERATTQRALEACARSELDEADRQLNAAYQAVIARHPGDPTFVERLRAAQRAWMAFRDAELEAIYPDQDEPLLHGTALSLCRTGHLTRLTRERTNELERWLEGVEEGDVCAGSFGVASEPEQ
jgi:uncharacterized protein YecT (DUF1311 family)